MPTGFEIAGVVLATLPLLVSAAEHRDVGLEPLNALFFFKKRKTALQHTVDENTMLFRQCCEKMLSIALIENIADLLAAGDIDQAKRLWADPPLQLKLEATFGRRDLNVILTRLQEIHKLVVKLQEYSNTGRLGQTFKSTSRAKDATLLRKAIVALQTVLEGESLSVVIGTAGTSWREEIEKMKATRKHFMNINNCVNQGWGCSCKKDHTINFQSRDIQDDNFKVILSPTSSRPGSKLAKLPWLLEPLQVSPCKQIQSVVSATKAAGLCKSLQTHTKIKELPPLSLDHHYLIQVHASLPDPKALIPLSGLLGKTSALTKVPGISRGHKQLIRTPRARIEIGARLLVTILQQHTVPWLHPDWTINDVFLRSGDGCSLNPYLEAPFDTTNPPAASPNQNPFKPFFSRNATLYNLGVALVEIAMNDTIDNLINDEDRDKAPNPSWARAFAAARLCDELADHLIPLEYRNATRYCLKGEFGVEIRGKELSDDDLFSTVYRKAAKPLMELVSRDCY